MAGFADADGGAVGVDEIIDDGETIVPVRQPSDRPRRVLIGLVLALASFSALTLTAGAEGAGSDADSVLPPELVPFLVGDDKLTPVTVVPRTRAPSLDEVVTAAVVSLDRYWSSEIERLYGVAFGPRPGLAPYVPSSGAIPPCGPDLTVELATRQAFYCSAGDYVGWDAEFLFPETYVVFHPLSPAVILAHEWAHAVQARADIVLTSLASELQADCFAGAWLAGSIDPLFVGLRSDFLDRSPRFFAWIGDPHDGAIGDQDRHGRAGERQAAFGEGYRRGAVACAVLESSGLIPDEEPRPTVGGG